jgi:hypothetical protein
VRGGIEGAHSIAKSAIEWGTRHPAILRAVEGATPAPNWAQKPGNVPSVPRFPLPHLDREAWAPSKHLRNSALAFGIQKDYYSQVTTT